MRAPWVIVGLLFLAMVPLQVSGAPAPGKDPTCGTGEPITVTSGAGDPALPSLVYASLKTGFRAVVAWETAEPEAARLRYSLDGGGSQIVSELVPRKFHLFVIEGLPIGHSFCFTPLGSGGAPIASQHAFLTRNAMSSHDGTAYTLNLLVLANEQSDLALVEAGIDGYASTLYDMTEGHVRAGRIVIVAGDVLHHNAGWPVCAAFILDPGCSANYDVLFTNGALPQGAASTTLDGIERRAGTIWMNWYWQGGLVNLGDDVGSVLAHEMGHYAFGALDVYGGSLNCWEPEKGLSIMGGSRAATEFDDEINRCPDAASIPSGYEPSYPRVRERFPLIPDRMGVIDPGPFGDGGRYARTTFRVLPALSDPLIEPPQIEQDDAGSGGDAGNFIVSATPIETGRLYDGVLLTPVDGADFYRFTAPAGSAIEVAMYPRVGCFDLLDGTGAAYGSACANDGIAAKRTAIGNGEPLYVKFALGDSPPYRFGVGVDAPAPGPV